MVHVMHTGYKRAVSGQVYDVAVDLRNDSKTFRKKELGWERKMTFEEGLLYTVQWYLLHNEWIQHILSGEYTKWIEKNYSKR
jgi:dTDP-D-glucose 4,6-dehydratase